MREISIIKECIKKFELDLSGMKVFTEAATENFRWTPIIAILANAEIVYSISKDSRFGKKEKAEFAVKELTDLLGIKDRLKIVYDYNSICSADIITNLGFVRPVTKHIIAQLKQTSVITLMCETWEYREEDLDLRACFEREILVMGTNEDHHDLQMFKYVGFLAMKLLYEIGLEIFRSKILIVGGHKFGESIVKSLTRNEASIRVVCKKKFLTKQIEPFWLAEFLNEDCTRDFLRTADAIIFSEHNFDGMLLGKKGELEVEELLELNEDIKIIHISGIIDEDSLLMNGFNLVPRYIPKISRKMSLTNGYLGPRPIIELHTAGLKVGEEMVRARFASLDFSEALKKASENILCQNFSKEQINYYRWEK